MKVLTKCTKRIIERMANWHLEIKRKIHDRIVEWKASTKGTKAVLIKGENWITMEECGISKKEVVKRNVW